MPLKHDSIGMTATSKENKQKKKKEKKKEQGNVC
jgi:hypothetical protein